MNKLFVKKFREEREMAVIMVVDTSASLFFGTQCSLKKDLAVELCAVLALSAIKSKDKAGLLLFDDEVRRYLAPKKGKPHVMRIIREMLAYNDFRQKTNIGAALTYINKILKRKSYVFVISDFFDDSYMKPLQMTARRHDVVPIVLRDAFEHDVPDIGVVPFEDNETGGVVHIDTSSRAYREKMKMQMEEYDTNLRQNFLKHNAEPVFIRTDSDYLSILMKYFKRRAGRY